MREYSFACEYCPASQLTHSPTPPSSWTPNHNGLGWICGHGQCQEDDDTRNRQQEEGYQQDYEDHFEEEAKYDAIEREHEDPYDPNPWGIS